MTRFLRTSACIIAFLASPALAADLPSRMPISPAPPPVAAPSSWAGCYVGGNLGPGWSFKRYANPSDSAVPGDRGTTTPNSFVGGGQVGCDYQTGPLVLGVQAMFNWSDMKGSFLDTVNPAFTETVQVRSFTTVTGRLGYVVMPSTLVYVKGGGAWVRDNHADIVSATNVVDATANVTRSGWTAGIGAEYMFAPNWTAFLEYNYLGFGTDRVHFAGTVAPFSFEVEQNVQNVLVGVNYRFGGLGLLGGRWF
jgi:outer membrane immunogenic protein